MPRERGCRPGHASARARRNTSRARRSARLPRRENRPRRLHARRVHGRTGHTHRRTARGRGGDRPGPRRRAGPRPATHPAASHQRLHGHPRHRLVEQPRARQRGRPQRIGPHCAGSGARSAEPRQPAHRLRQTRPHLAPRFCWTASSTRSAGPCPGTATIYVQHPGTSPKSTGRMACRPAGGNERGPTPRRPAQPAAGYLPSE